MSLTSSPKRPLPITPAEVGERGWSELDVIIVTGDAYVDHPSFGAAMIGRVLEAQGWRVGVIPQPDWRSTTDFMRLGRPRLFFGVTAGNVDSMLAHYTANRRLRRCDDYSPGGKYGLRPNRATIVYANRLREAFPDTPIVIGGIEASLRRFAHYDFWSDRVRRSILQDSRADILVYGMGEEQVVEIARRIAAGQDVRTMGGVRGTVVLRSEVADLGEFVELPSFEEVASSREKFCEAYKKFFAETNPASARPLVQKSSGQYVVQFPPPLPVPPERLDFYYELPFTRAAHPVYDAQGGVPALETVVGSITTHRGCYGGCSFCALSAHQGRTVVSRTIASLVREVESMRTCVSFRGVITDAGGPTANMYGTGCRDASAKASCRRSSCLMPVICRNLRTDHSDYLRALGALQKIKGIRSVRIATGIRFDLALADSSGNFIEELCRNYVGGQIKVAPEHSEDAVLKIMNKPSFEVYEKFMREYSALNRKLGLDQHQVEYYMAAHPGCRMEDAKRLSNCLKRRRLSPRQAQTFTPTPMTLSTCIYHTGSHPLTGESIYVPKSDRERREQMALLQWKKGTRSKGWREWE